MRFKRTIVMLALLSIPFASIAQAHPGRTDKNGGHTCRTNCAKWGLKTGEYHYHNTDSSSSSSSSSTSGSSATSSAKSAPASKPVTETLPEGTVQVSLPTFDVYINGQHIENESTPYPVIVYKQIAYFPMTWNYTQALALETVWDADVGFVVRQTEREPAALELDSGTPPAKLYAKLPDFNVYVNDTWIDNGAETYPILVFNDITYFPMTWHYAVEELGLTTSFADNTFSVAK